MWAWREIIIPGGVANVRFGDRIIVVLEGNKIKFVSIKNSSSRFGSDLWDLP